MGGHPDVGGRLTRLRDNPRARVVDAEERTVVTFCGCNSWMDSHTERCGFWALFRVTVEILLRRSLIADYYFQRHRREFYLAESYRHGGAEAYRSHKRRMLSGRSWTETVLPPGTFY